jgi:selenocysteine-specific elongation factor
MIEDAGLKTVELLQIVRRFGFPAARVKERLRDLAKEGRIRILSENPLIAVSARAFKDASDRAVAEMKRFHQTNPLVQGIGREEFKTRVFGEASNLVVQSALDKLAGDKKIVASHDIIHEFGRKVTLQADEERMRDQLSERFRSLGLQVPTPDELIDGLKLDRTRARKIVQLMLKENALVKISEEILIDRATMDKLITDVKALKPKNPRLGVGEFKDLTGVSRKYAIPLLEYLDRQRVTRRVGDERLIL